MMGLNLFEKSLIVIVLALSVISFLFYFDNQSSISGQTVSPLVDGSKTHYIEIVDNGFNPEYIEIKKGDSVVWVNKGLVKHTISFSDYSLANSDEIEPNALHSYRFDKVGDYLYVCDIHSGMTGKIVVLDK